ncbi:hypothetical protein DFH06DRAFT_1229687 [Mycena polygramma]|nr:hypothetical protein DFH06DRAFT_1229687 [Mycena polygramma]
MKLESFPTMSLANPYLPFHWTLHNAATKIVCGACSCSTLTMPVTRTGKGEPWPELRKLAVRQSAARRRINCANGTESSAKGSRGRDDRSMSLNGANTTLVVPGGMGLWQAISWCMRRPEEETPRARYPTIATADERQQAWVEDNRQKIEEATTALLAFHAEFPPGASVNSSGSFFECSEKSFNVLIYWNPTTITLDHDDFRYVVSEPQHVDAAHALRDWAAAVSYIHAHCDSRTAIQPLVITVRAVLLPDVLPGCAHPDEGPSAPHDAATLRLPIIHDVKEANGQGKYTVRYTLHGSRKRHEYMYARAYDWPAILRARHRYLTDHYDLKEVLDADGKVISSELGINSRHELERL